MRNSLIAKLLGFLLLYPLSINSAISQNIDSQLLSNQLEAILNKKKFDLTNELFLEKAFKQFEKQYIDFTKKYKNTKWSIKTISNQQDKILIDVNIISTRKIGTQIYNLNSKQTVEIVTLKDKIKSYEILNEESILNSQTSPIFVKIIAPDKVLTGQKYELNFIIEKPLDNSLIASGIIVLDNKSYLNISNNYFGIKPNKSGGLFKYIQAPLEPGFQTISAIITHPKGIYSITKKIEVGLE